MNSAPAATFDDLLRRLALVVQLPVSRRILVGRVQDRMVEEWVIHYDFELILPLTKQLQPRNQSHIAKQNYL